MFPWMKSETPLDREIDRLLKELKSLGPDDYETTMSRIEKLTKMRDAEKPSRQISPDTVILAVTNLVGILLIIRHEHVNVITSKAMGHVMKAR